METIIARIQKLLSLATGKGASEEEAALAMAKAQELLAKHNLDMALVQGSLVGGSKPEEEKRDRSQLDRSAMYKWQQKLCQAIASTNFCYHWTTWCIERKSDGKSRRVRRHVIVGKEVNLVAVRIMYEYLCDIMEEILPYPNNERISRSAMSWREGCVDRLIRRLWSKYHEMQANQQVVTDSQGTKTTMGVVLRSMYDKEMEANYDKVCGAGAYAEYMARYNSRTEEEKEKHAKRQHREYEREQRRTENRDHDAYRAGAQAGSQISLQNRVN